LTEEIIKWDIEDQTFINKEFQKKEGESQERLVEMEEPDEFVDKIVWLNQGNAKMKEIDLTKAVDKSWKDQTQVGSNNQIYKNSLL
jgi:hypothetical protein